MPMIVDRTAWGHLRVDGPDHLRFLQGLCTVHLEVLPAGGHAWGAILSPKGRVLTVIQTTRQPDHVVVHCEPALLAKTLALLERYAVMDEVAFTRLEVAAHTIWPTPGDPAGAAAAWQAPLVLAPPPGEPAPAGDVEIVRVEAGIPRYGVDVDEDHFPFETPLARWLDYGKGCYVGQEPVFRVHSQGQAARMLRALQIEGDGAVAPGTPVAHAARPQAGTVTSSVVSPRHGPIALAYLHRTVWAPGGEVTVDGRRATVRELPLGPDA
jgi:tRNA-modifying protein YgfZ